MQIDAAFQQILPKLQLITHPTLWYADENALSILEQVPANPLLTLVTNRYDIYQQALTKKITAIFTDFDINDYPQESFDQIIYRVPKEKALAHFLINQAAQLLTTDGTLTLSGYKQEGIKSYAEKLKKELNASGSLKKSGNAYKGTFSNINKKYQLDDQQYSKLRKIIPKNNTNKEFYSKPGTFGWDKIDKGTQLLLETFGSIYKNIQPKPNNVLDLGCGYGWIFLNLDKYNFSNITATDNNAAALLSAKANSQLINTPTTIAAGDCANTINSTFDLILCNPPFHQGFAHSKELTDKFITTCYQKLKKNGLALLVTNEFVTFDKKAEALFSKQEALKKDQGFKVTLLIKS